MYLLSQSSQRINWFSKTVKAWSNIKGGVEIKSRILGTHQWLQLNITQEWIEFIKITTLCEVFYVQNF